MTCESLSHLREWLYPQRAKSAGINPLLPVEMWEELSQTVPDLEKDWCGQKPSWFSPPNSFSFSLGRCCSTLPTFLHLGLDYLSSKIWARLWMWWRVIYHGTFVLLFNNKALLLRGIWVNVEVYIGQDPCMLSYLHPAECIQGAQLTQPSAVRFFFTCYLWLCYIFLNISPSCQSKALPDEW